jgi:hypothetical protein
MHSTVGVWGCRLLYWSANDPEVCGFMFGSVLTLAFFQLLSTCTKHAFADKIDAYEVHWNMHAHRFIYYINPVQTCIHTHTICII